ncbi:hypothetical protein HDV00_009126 [Rhizophlyctis rosea]|nr:hypothetical protein HDV00_009126 [Rhizophlyctis rosea]
MSQPVNRSSHFTEVPPRGATQPADHHHLEVRPSDVPRVIPQTPTSRALPNARTPQPNDVVPTTTKPRTTPFHGLKRQKRNHPPQQGPKIPGPAGKLPDLSSEEIQILFSTRERTVAPLETDETGEVQSIFFGREDDVADEEVALVPSQDDNDFESVAWVNASRCLGADDALADIQGLQSVLDMESMGKTGRLVVIIKELKQTDLDAGASFKDASASIRGVIHRKVFEELADVVVPGAVLELKNVTLFKPSHTARYLNILLSNIVSIFTVSGTPPRVGQNGQPLPFVVRPTPVVRTFSLASGDGDGEEEVPLVRNGKRIRDGGDGDGDGGVGVGVGDGGGELDVGEDLDVGWDVDLE